MLDMGAVVLAYALGGGIVRGLIGSSAAEYLGTAIIGMVVLGSLLLGPIMLIAQRYKGRDLPLGVGEWIWLVHAGFWFTCLLMLRAVSGGDINWGMFIFSLIRWASLVVTAVTPLVAFGAFMSWLIARRSEAAHPWTDVAGAFICGGLSVVLFIPRVLYGF